MPNRVLRDWTASEKIDKISFQAEALFTRLMMKADDYGSYHANPKLIKAFCFPLKNLRETEISRWLQELESAGIIALYDAENKPYLHIIDFGQRLRTMSSKFPQIHINQLNNKIADECQQYADNSPPETEVETEVEDEGEGEKKTTTNFKNLTKEEFHAELKNFVDDFGKEVVTKFFNYWSEKDPKGKMKFQLQKTWETKLRLITWKNNEPKWKT